jgi:hypothetical protein
MCDAVLFCQPHPYPYLPISLFWCVLILSFVTFAEIYLGLHSIKEEYQSAKKAGNFDRSLARLMTEERNVWISGSTLGLWIILHRYRSLLKKYQGIVDEYELNLPIVRQRSVTFKDKVDGQFDVKSRIPKNSATKKND